MNRKKQRAENGAPELHEKFLALVFCLSEESVFIFRSELVVPLYMILFPFVDFHFECNNSSTVRSESFVLIYMILFPFVDFHFEFNNSSTVRSELVVPI